MTNFDTVVIRSIEVGAPATCVRLAVHPFPVLSGIHISLAKGHYGREGLVLWQQELIDALWDKVPGVQDIILSNGFIQIAHAGLFDATEIGEAVIAIVRPYLENQLALMGIEL